MVTSVTQASSETTTTAAVHPVPHVVHEKPAPTIAHTQPANTSDRPGTDGMDFMRANRIHVHHGSLFIDPYLVIHPRELNPVNEAVLRAKMQLTYGINNPSFYEAPERVAIALNLGQLVPVSLPAKRSKLLDEVKKFNTQVDSGADAGLQQQAGDKRAPFGAIVRDTVENPEVDPVGLELLKNGLSIYLLARQKLTENHFLNKLSDYVERSNTPDQVLNDLADKIGVTPRDIREAALKGGIDGVGELLKLDPKYVADVKQLAEYAAGHDFGYNMVEHWYIGQQVLGPNASLQDKITTGMDRRITSKIGEYRARVRNYYETPEAIQKTETRIARDDMAVLEPIQRQLMFALGYEICHTPENTADAIAFHKGVYGLHRKAANDLSDIRGTYRIFYGGHGTLEGAVGTLAHEVAHNFWPSYFTKEDTQRIDQLAASDQDRFANLQKLMDERFDSFENLLRAYQAGDAREKQAVIGAANDQFKEYGITVDDLFPYLIDGKSFRFMVWQANDVLQVEGGRYNKSGYDTPQERFREVISRFAELRQVSHRDQPAVLRILAPGLTEIWENHYIPHLERVYQDVVAQQGKPTVADTQAMRTPALADETPAPAPDELPKVEERPSQRPAGTPVAAATHAAQVSDMPTNAILAQGAAVNPLLQSGLSAIESMRLH